MQSDGTLSGRPFGTPVPKEKSTPRHIPPQNVGKCEAPTLYVKTKKEVTQGKMTASTFEL